ncbi:MAG: hypothetical protein ABIG68_11480 [Acidobacteriota bacterium]
MRIPVVTWIGLLICGAPRFAGRAQEQAKPVAPPETSGYFAFVDRDFIFTIEVVQPGVPLFNFVSMVEEEHQLPAREVRLALQNRTVPATFFLVDTGNPDEPLIVPSLRIRPRSSFGVRLQGEYGENRELYGASVRLGPEDLHLALLSSFEFENLVLKINRINLGSPDFRDDWRVLKIEPMGRRERIRRRK